MQHFGENLSDDLDFLEACFDGVRKELCGEKAVLQELEIISRRMRKDIERLRREVESLREKVVNLGGDN